MHAERMRAIFELFSACVTLRGSISFYYGGALCHTQTSVDQR
jgi:hypothetical protein